MKCIREKGMLMVRTSRTQLQGLQKATKEVAYEDCGTGNATPATCGKN